jgi:lipopolysaccharide transport system permease protein
MNPQMTAVRHNGISELVQYRHLLLSLTLRDLRVRYKQSVLGMAWALLLPLAMMLIFTFVFTRAVKLSSTLDLGMPYPLFAYLGLVPWTFFSSSLNGAVNSLTANRNLVTKVYFPREVFPLASVGSAFVDFLVAAVMLVLLIVYFNLTAGAWHFTLSWTLLFVPVIVVVQIVLTTGLGLLLAMANLFFRDVRQLFTVFIQLWMFLTCVVYPIRNDGSRWGMLLLCNPMTPIIQAYRDCIVDGRMPHGGAFTAACCTSAAIFLLGWFGFRRWSPKFAEYI